MPTPEARDDQEDRYERDRFHDREDDRQPIKRCMGVTALQSELSFEILNEAPNTSKYIQIHHKSI